MLHTTMGNMPERQTEYYFDDGLFEIVLGAGLLLAAICIMTVPEAFWLVAIIPPLVISLMRSLKKAITAPRLRSDEVPPDAEQRMQTARRVAMGVTALLLLLGLLAFVAVSTNLLPPASVSWPWIAGGILSILLAMLGYLGWASRTWRFGVYVALTFIVMLVSFWLQLGIAAPLLLMGTVITIWGAILLMQFLRDHPRRQQGTA